MNQESRDAVGLDVFGKMAKAIKDMTNKKQILIVTFKSEYTLDEWRVKKFVMARHYNLRMIKIEKFFQNQFRLIRGNIEQKILKEIGTKKIQKAMFIGHGLGGAFAMIAGISFTVPHLPSKFPFLIEVYTFGQPRLGDQAFSHYIDSIGKKILKTFRITIGDDFVSRLPFDYSEQSQNSALIWKHQRNEFWVEHVYKCDCEKDGDDKFWNDKMKIIEKVWFCQGPLVDGIKRIRNESQQMRKMKKGRSMATATVGNFNGNNNLEFFSGNSNNNNLGSFNDNDN
ncbi:hypothetical protein G9A89_001018 [Geosiphon pyriformis]|nr:hypothetical protein G9A89_001018 [Geosiphon pyriformis]